MGGRDNDGGIRCNGFELFKQRKSVHAWHANVTDDRFGGFVLKCREQCIGIFKGFTGDIVTA